MVAARSRGQAAVEFALGALVFITILLFGIHFAEIGYLSLKVTEANASALWHSTSVKMHELPSDFSKLDNFISGNKAGAAAQELYEDFDGRSSTSGRNESPQVFTRAHGLRVTCEAGGPSFAPVATTTDVYDNTGGMVCRSEATLEVLPIFPRSFLDTGDGAFFQERHYEATDLTICGVNRAGNGCTGQFAILLDDWALASGNELKNCRVLDGSGCDNQPFYKSTESVYTQHVQVTGDAVSLARQSVMQAPDFDPGTFYHSFYSANGDFQDKVNPGDQDPVSWVTTPGAGSPTVEYGQSYTDRKECWLGLKCN